MAARMTMLAQLSKLNVSLLLSKLELHAGRPLVARRKRDRMAVYDQWKWERGRCTGPFPIHRRFASFRFSLTLDDEDKDVSLR